MLKTWLRQNFFIFTALLQGVTWICDDAYLGALPYVAKTLQVSNATAEYGISLIFIGTIMTNIFAGNLADKFGYRPVLFFGVAGFTAVNVAITYVDNITAFLFLRFVSGLIMPFIYAPMNSVLGHYYDSKRLPKIYAMQSNISLFATMGAPFVGSFIISYFHNWHYIFGLNAFLVFLCLIPIFIVYPKTGEKMPNYVYNEEEEDVDYRTSGLNIKQVLIYAIKDKMFNRLVLSGAMFALFSIIWVTMSPDLYYHYGVETYEYATHFGAANLGFALGIIGGSIIGDKYGVLRVFKHILVLTVISAIVAVCIFQMIDNQYSLTSFVFILNFFAAATLSFSGAYVVKRAKFKGTISGFRDTLTTFFMAIGGMLAPTIGEMGSYTGLIALSITSVATVYLFYKAMFIYDKEEMEFNPVLHRHI